MSGTEAFSVYWIDRSGNLHKEKTLVPIEEASSAMLRLTKGPAAKLGVVKEVKITDIQDCLCFLWKDGVVIFPTKEEIEEATNQEP